MNNKKIFFAATMAFGIAFSLTGCGEEPAPVAKFNFALGLSSGRTDTVYLDADYSGDKVVYYEFNAGKEARSYTYSIEEGDQYLEVYRDGTLNPLKESGDNWVTVAVTEATSGLKRTLDLQVKKFPEAVDGGYNWASDSNIRNEILGKLERYAMENYLTGITLFENGGYVRYSDRIHLPTKEYITGFGFGLLSEGWIEGTLPDGSKQYPSYLHNASSSDPLTINAWNATGSQVSDLNGYITSSYWGTKLDGTTKYKWYPVLAKDKVNGQDFNRPMPLKKVDGQWTPVTNPKETDTFTRFRIYVKTGEAGEEGLQYRTGSTNMARFDKRPVKLEDYEFVYKLLLTERSDLMRGAELAGDTTHGIKGALTFFNRTKDIYNIDDIDSMWDLMQQSGDLGIATGKDSNGSYLELELVNPINTFTAMYTLSSNLYSPIPREFVEALDMVTPEGQPKSYIEGVQNYGNYSDKKDILDTVLCVGPYYLAEWNKNTDTVFSRNNDWYEVKTGNMYKIEGVYLRILSSATQDPNAIYDHFENGEFDSTGIPTQRMDQKKESDLKTKGSSTFKLNVNSTSQERWNELFGKNGTIKKGTDNEYEVKPWMSNKNFLNGLYWSIDRKSFADARGVNPSVSYLADAYMSDPQKGTSYNTTDEHKEAIAPFHDAKNEDYGYNIDKAITYFQMAVNELVDDGVIVKGTESNPTPIEIDIMWMYASDKTEYGNEIGGYFTKAFNNKKVSNGTVKLIVNNDAVTQWDKVYSDHLQVGKYDLGFGAISGNTYDPLNFFEVLKSDNSSYFTLNWGDDTSKVNAVNPITFVEDPTNPNSPEKAWSFDALWEAADHGSIVNKGQPIKPVKDAYINGTPKTYDGAAETNALYDGAQVNIDFTFVDIDRPEGEIELQISRINLWLKKVPSVGFDLNDDSKVRITKNGNAYHVTLFIDPTTAAKINSDLVTSNDLETKAQEAERKGQTEEAFALRHPFQQSNYNSYFNFEFYYTLSINGGYPVETLVNISIDKESQPTRSFALANK